MTMNKTILAEPPFTVTDEDDNFGPWSALRSKKPRRSADPWLLLTLVAACCASIVAVWHFAERYQILLLGDTYAHMLIARRLFDNSTPGIAQLGGIWLP